MTSVLVCKGNSYPKRLEAQSTRQLAFLMQGIAWHRNPWGSAIGKSCLARDAKPASSDRKDSGAITELDKIQMLPSALVKVISGPPSMRKAPPYSLSRTPDGSCVLHVMVVVVLFN